MAKNFHVRFEVKDEDTLRKLPIQDLDMGCTGGVEQRDDGTLVLHAITSEVVLKKCRQVRGVKVEVLADLAKAAAKMKKQVGKGNRFTGEDRVPRGRGRKVRDEEER